MALLSGKELAMAKFMMILQSRPGVWDDVPPAEMERKMERYRAWDQKIRDEGRKVSGEKLAEEGGKVVSLQKGKVSVVDGPYAEAKEVVGGYVVFRAADYEEALALMRECPALEDYRIFLRQTDVNGCGGE
jgi:hypothetical protein